MENEKGLSQKFPKFNFPNFSGICKGVIPMFDKVVTDREEGKQAKMKLCEK